MSLRILRLACPLIALAASAAHADWRPDGGFVEWGHTAHHGNALTAGLTWQGRWHRDWGPVYVTGSVEAFASRWAWDRTTPGNSHSVVVGVVPLARFSAGPASRWFAEAGIGLSLADQRYSTDDKQFSTRFNFYDVLAVGHSFGAQRQQELSLRVTHVSNGGIRHPNPGENFLQVRWATRF
jgi:hypothetical protein